MTISITHTFVSGISDDPADVTAGKVVPSEWNAEHTLSGLGTAAEADVGDFDVAGAAAAAQAASQPLDSDLTAIAALTTATFGRSLLTQADAAAARSTIGVGTVSTLASDTDGTLAANSDSRVATQKAVKTYVDGAVTGLLDFKGSQDASGNPNYPAASKGDAYYVSVAGKVGGASGKSVDVGDVFVASADNAGGSEASVGTSWFVLEHNLVGAVVSGGALGTPSSGDATNLTNIPAGQLTGSIAAARMPALTGDVTTSAGAVATTLATVNSNVGTFRNATVTASAKGLITAVATTSGTSFPGSPASGDRFFRTDLGLDCYYDGTRWLTVQEYTARLGIDDALDPVTNTTTGGRQFAPVDLSQAGLWVTRAAFGTYVNATNSASLYWTVQLVTLGATASVVDTLGSSFNTSADTQANYTTHMVTVGAAITTSTSKFFAATVTKTSTPGGIYFFATVFYRLIVT